MTGGVGRTPLLDSAGPMASILVVCTGNICRSPVAEAMLRALLADRLGDGAPMVASAGTAGWEGSGASPESVKAAAERGIDISGHVARRLRVDHVVDADLVIGMAAEHRDAIALAVPAAVAKTFTLKELVHLLEVSAAAPNDDVANGIHVRISAAERLRRSDERGMGRFDEDVADPLGQPLATYRAMAGELQEWTQRLVDALYGDVPEAARTLRGGS